MTRQQVEWVTEWFAPERDPLRLLAQDPMDGLTSWELAGLTVAEVREFLAYH